MAESVLRNLTSSLEPTWHIDSAAIADWNVGLSPEPRAICVLAENGLRSEHIARQIRRDDFYEFDYIFGMDDYNMADLRAMAPADASARVEMLGTYDFGRPEVIPDPYFVSVGQLAVAVAGHYNIIFLGCENVLAGTWNRWI